MEGRVLTGLVEAEVIVGVLLAGGAVGGVLFPRRALSKTIG